MITLLLVLAAYFILIVVVIVIDRKNMPDREAAYMEPDLYKEIDEIGSEEKEEAYPK